MLSRNRRDDAAAGASRFHGARSHTTGAHPRSIRAGPSRGDRPGPRFPHGGVTEYRELRQGDNVSKGDLLGLFYSVDVGSKKNDLLEALVQLELDQKILDEAEKHG